MRLSNDILQVNRQKLLNAFPTDIKQNVEIVSDFLLDKTFDIHPTVEQEIVLNGQKLIIPGRVYFDNPTETTGNNLTTLQQTILNCIYLRHHNGFVRQKRLEKLIDNTSDYFVIPYIFQLLGEYVMEILVVADKHINGKTIDNYLKFSEENTKYRQQTESRMISYWNEYYRAIPTYRKLNDYIGKQIFDRLKKANAQRPVWQESGETSSIEPFLLILRCRLRLKFCGGNPLPRQAGQTFSASLANRTNSTFGFPTAQIQCSKTKRAVFLPSH